MAARRLVLPPRRPFSIARSIGRCMYHDTLPHLKINEHTRVIYQGFTGKQATANALQSIEWGTNVVGGVTPGKSGEHLGLPLLPNMKEAAQVLQPDATAVFVAAQHAARAIEDALEAEIPLIVAVAEHVPVHDMLRLHSMLATQCVSRLVGPNCPGIINPVSRTRVGFLPHTVFSPGTIGIVAKSGTLSYEAVASTTRAGLGQSLVIGMGGDWLAGTSLLDGVKVFMDDDRTEGIIIIGEVGGMAEMEVAEYLNLYQGRRKPIMGLMAGLTAVEGRIMGHAGAVRNVGDMSAEEKKKMLEEAGVEMVTHPGQFGEGMRRLLRKPPMAVPGSRREMHTAARVRRRHLHLQSSTQPPGESLEDIFLRDFPRLALVRKLPDATDIAGHYTITVTIDRQHLSPCLHATSLTTGAQTTVLFDYMIGPAAGHIHQLAHALSLAYAPAPISEALTDIVSALWKTFKAREAYSITLSNVILKAGDSALVVAPGMTLLLDDAAFNSAGRQEDLVRLRRPAPEEAAAHAAGIVFFRLPGTDANIGTLVNGAGLAMNTNDALVAYGGQPANFLDTGGKATKETVKEGLRLVLADPRVKVVFVNIFGGLTRGIMIAEGIILGFKELGIQVPVVVRIRGTEEAEGQAMIRESGLPLFAFDELDDAARKVIELAGRE